MQQKLEHPSNTVAMVEFISLIKRPTINNELPKDDEIRILKVEASYTWNQMNSLFLEYYTKSKSQCIHPPLV